MFLIFRGTNSPTDAIADVMFRPETAPNGVMIHGGFLRTTLGDAKLRAALEKHVIGDTELYVFGHSLGGALSQVVAGAGVLPAAFTGRLTVISLGGPVVFYKEPEPAKFSDQAASARVISIVNANDIVPRLLGCPLSSTRKVSEPVPVPTSVSSVQSVAPACTCAQSQVLSIFASTNNSRNQREVEVILDTLEQCATRSRCPRSAKPYGCHARTDGTPTSHAMLLPAGTEASQITSSSSSSTVRRSESLRQIDFSCCTLPRPSTRAASPIT